MLSAGQRVAAAVSGGADSVCLLHALIELGFAPHVLHVNHHLRGAESQADADFVVDLSARLGLPCSVHESPVEPGVDNLEQAARNLRLAVFHEAVSSGAVDRVALGHTRSDQAETVLFRFLRGAGTAGLAGIRPVTSGGLIRPLIEIDRVEARAWLLERGITWREDSSNLSLEFARNRIRQNLLPQLAREWNPAIAETLAQTADWALEEEAYWHERMGELAATHLVAAQAPAVLMRAEALRLQPLAAARRLVRRAMELSKGDLRGIGFGHIEAVLKLAGGPEGGWARAPGLDICRSFDWIRFAPPAAAESYRLEAPVPGFTPVPGTDIGISLELIENSETFRTGNSVYNNNEVGWLDWNRLSSGLQLRNWRPGDRYQPAGASGEEKVTDLFQRARVPLWERGKWPILMDGPRIVWARRFGPAAVCAAGPESSVVLKVAEVTAR